jgi:outer membrane protein TolC
VVTRLLGRAFETVLAPDGVRLYLMTDNLTPAMIERARGTATLSLGDGRVLHLPLVKQDPRPGERATYFCPMHPEVVQPDSGKCQPCGGMILYAQDYLFGAANLGTPAGIRVLIQVTGLGDLAGDAIFAPAFPTPEPKAGSTPPVTAPPSQATETLAAVEGAETEPLAPLTGWLGEQDGGAVAQAAVDSLVALALRRSPDLEAGTERVAAATAASPAAGALPDPMVALSLRGESYPGAGLGEDPMAMASLEFTQTIPWPGRRGRREAAARAEIGVANAGLELSRRRLAAEVREVYAELCALANEEQAIEQSLDLLAILLSSAGSRYAVGQAEQTDLVRLQIERDRWLDSLDLTRAMRSEHAARLAALLNLDPAEPMLGAVGLPGLSHPEGGPGLSAATNADGRNLAAADTALAGEFAEVLAAIAGVERARLRAAAADHEGTPDLVLGTEYGWRDGMPPMILARLGVELPLWSGRKQGALAAASHREVAMAEADLRAATAAARSQTMALQARILAAARRADRLRTETMPKVALAVESARADYGAGRGDLDAVIMGLQQLAETRAQLGRRQAEHYAAFARLQALRGLDPVLSLEE